MYMCKENICIAYLQSKIVQAEFGWVSRSFRYQELRAINFVVYQRENDKPQFNTRV